MFEIVQNLFEIVKNRLDDFGIKLDQVFAVTTDNEKKMVKLFREYDTDNFNQPLPQHSSESGSDNEHDDERIGMDHNWNGACGDEFFDHNDEYFRDLLTNLRCEFSNACYNGLLAGISCAAHCLNLVVTDAIKDYADLSDLIDKCRVLVKKLRTPSLRSALKEKKTKDG